MRRIILLMLLAVVSNNSNADWVKVGTGGDVVAYVDTSSFSQEEGRFVKQWVLYDQSKADKLTFTSGTYWSITALEEYDCKQEKSRSLQTNFHSKRMGKGETVYSNNDITDWVFVTPDSVGRALWHYACTHSWQAVPGVVPPSEEYLKYDENTKIGVIRYKSDMEQRDAVISKIEDVCNTKNVALIAGEAKKKGASYLTLEENIEHNHIEIKFQCLY